MRGTSVVVGLILGAVGCGEVKDSPSDGGTDTITLPPDAGACEMVVDECATEDVLRSCTTVGENPVDTICPAGCSPAGGAHCSVLTPRFGLTREDMAPTVGLEDVTLAATTTINGTDGSITNVRAAGEGIVGGGGGGGASRGTHGRLMVATAAGGVGSTGFGPGGAGSISSTIPGTGTFQGMGGGGGGGAAGRVLVFSGDGVLDSGGAMFSPPVTVGTVAVE